MRLFYLFFPMVAFQLVTFQIRSQEFTMSENQIVIPFEVSESKIFFRAMVNGKKLNLILDSGAGNNHILMEDVYAKAMGLEFQPPLSNGLGLGAQKREVAIAKGTVQVNIGGMKISSVPLIRTGLHSIIGPYSSIKPDGVFGGCIFNEFVVTIDFKSKQILINKEIDYSKDLGQAIPIRVHQGRALINAEFTLSNGSKAKGEFTFDTGARTTLFHKSFLEDLNLQKLKDTISVLGGIGFSGKVFGKRTIAETLTIGEFSMNKIPILFAWEQPVQVGKTMGDDGLIGYDFIKNFIVTFDYGNNLIYLKQYQPLKATYDMTGLFLSKDANGNFKVEYVVVGSPAFSSGLRENDMIYKVGGIAAQEISIQEFNELFQKEATTLEVEFRRGNKLITNNLKSSNYMLKLQ